MENKIKAIKLYKVTEKKGESVSCNSLNLIKEKGIEGDYYAKGGSRQITLMSPELEERIKKAIQKAKDNREAGICLKRYKYNILIDGASIETFEVGDKIFLNDVEIEISERKGCHEDDCPLAKSKKSCPIRGLALYGRVTKSGKVEVEIK